MQGIVIGKPVFGSYRLRWQGGAEECGKDSSWAAWLDGFLCVVKNKRVTRITLKMAVYLDFVYTDKRQKPALQLRSACRGRGGQRRAGPGRAGKRRAAQGSAAGPILLDFSLTELGKESGAVRITDCEYLWDIMIDRLDPSGQEKPTEALRNIRRLTSPPYIHALNPPNIDDVIIHEDGVPMYQIEPMGAENLDNLGDIWGAEPAEDENVFQLPAQIDINQLAQIGEGQQNMNNNNDENQENQDPEGGDDDEGEEAAAGDGPPPPAPHLHDNVWDALINDDLRQIGDLYERKELIIEDYLE